MIPFNPQDVLFVALLAFLMIVLLMYYIADLAMWVSYVLSDWLLSLRWHTERLLIRCGLLDP